MAFIDRQRPGRRDRHPFLAAFELQVPPSDAADEPLSSFERVTAVNQRGVWACMKHELRVMREKARARSSTARRWAALWGSPAAPPITAPSTPCWG